MVNSVAAPSVAAFGNNMTSTISILNNDAGEALESFSVGVYVSADSDISAVDHYLGSYVINGLSGYGVDSREVPLTLLNGAIYEDAEWIQTQGVQVDGNSLSRTAAYTGQWDAGAFSVQSLTGDGAVKFNIPTGQSYVALGLSYGNINNDPDTADYVIERVYCSGHGMIAIYVKGVKKTPAG